MRALFQSDVSRLLCRGRQCWQKPLLVIGPDHRSGKPEQHGAVPVHNKSFWRRCDAPINRCSPAWVKPSGEKRIAVFDQIFSGFVRLVAEIKTCNAVILCLQIQQRWVFCAARRTPARPKIQDRDLAVAQIDACQQSSSRNRFGGQFRRLLTDKS